MLFQMDADNNVQKWMLRVGGWLMVWLGLQMFLGPLAVLPDVVPCIGPMLGDMVGCALCCCTCGSSFTLATIVFAVAWLFVRPLYGGIALALSVGACFMAVKARHGAGEKNKT